jgi:hypothetical protein
VIVGTVKKSMAAMALFRVRSRCGRSTPTPT